MKNKGGQDDKYHCDRFLSKGVRSRALVLKRYARVEQFGTRKELLRHTCHSCAWLISLPLEVALSDYDGLSPIGVFTKMIQNRRHGPLSERLSKALERLQVRVAALLDDTCISGEARACWQNLERYLSQNSRKRTRAEAEDVNEIGSDEPSRTELDTGTHHYQPSDVQHDRILRRFSKYERHVANCIHQSHDVTELLQQAHEASHNGDALKLCQLLLKGVAWLAKPRTKAQIHGDEAMTEAAKQRLQVELQSKVRQTILVCLRGLDLQDPGTCQRTDVRVSMFQMQQIMHGVELDQVLASRQWLAIKSLIDGSNLQHAESAPLHTQQKTPQRGVLAANAKGDKFTPAPLVQNSSLVRRGTGVVLICQGCQKRLVSEWQFQKKAGEWNVIVPGSGHFNTKTTMCGHYYPEDKSVKFTSDKTVVRRVR